MDSRTMQYSRAFGPRPRWWSGLAFGLAIAIPLCVIILLAAFGSH